MKELCKLEGYCSIVQEEDGRVHFQADADIDADGAYRAYHEKNWPGLDNLANAGHPGNWWGLVTNNGKPDGLPIVQTEGDPAPGFFVSSTAYQWPQFDAFDPRRYLDSETIPFIAVEGFIRRRARGVVLGCKARVTNRKTGLSVDAVVGDTGPLYKIGELSIAAAKAIGVNSDARKGGEEEHVILYELWPDLPAEIAGVRYDLIRAIPDR